MKEKLIDLIVKYSNELASFQLCTDYGMKAENDGRAKQLQEVINDLRDVIQDNSKPTPRTWTADEIARAMSTARNVMFGEQKIGDMKNEQTK